MECNFVVGQKVIYTGQIKLSQRERNINRPIIGEIYTIRLIRIAWGGDEVGLVPALQLVEITNKPLVVRTSPITTDCREPAFIAANFKPVHTGMQTLENILRRPLDHIPDDGKQKKSPKKVKENV